MIVVGWWVSGKPPPVDFCAELRQKLPLAQAMLREPDKRVINPANARKEALFKQDKTKAEANAVAVYLNLLRVASSLQKHKIMAANRDELAGALNAMERNDVEFPLEVKQSLVARRVCDLQSAERYDDVVRILEPWEVGVFNVHAPMLGHISEMTAEDRVALFERITFKEMLVPLLLRGMAGKDTAMRLARSALARFAMVDIVRLGVDEARSLNDACDIWKALISYGDASTGVECKATMCGCGASEMRSVGLDV